jgi:hypothetical protein
MKPLRSRQVDDMQGEEMGAGCDTKEGISRCRWTERWDG